MSDRDAFTTATELRARFPSCQQGNCPRAPLRGYNPTGRCPEHLEEYRKLIADPTPIRRDAKGNPVASEEPMLTAQRWPVLGPWIRGYMLLIAWLLGRVVIPSKRPG